MLAEGATREEFESVVGLEILVNHFICIPTWVMCCASYDVFFIVVLDPVKNKNTIVTSPDHMLCRSGRFTAFLQ